MDQTLAGRIAYDSPVPPTDADTDLDLLRRLRDGETECADILLTRSYKGVWRSLCRLTGNPDQAADLTQETFRKAWEALPSFDGRASFSTWLYRIAYTTFLNTMRRPRLVVPLEESVAANAVTDQPSPEQAAADGESNVRLREAVLQLPDELRFVITAHYWGELSVREIADASGLTSMGIRKRLRRAQEQLTRSIGDLK